MPDVKKAELVNGVVHIPSPVSIDAHGEQHFHFMGWLFTYRAHTPGVQGGDNATLKLPIGMNQPQADACLRIKPEYGGQSSMKDGYVLGGVELAGEISASTVSFDLNEKLAAYEANSVLEYVVWRVEDSEIDWFFLKAGVYHPMPLTKHGIYKSKVFPGLWLDSRAMIDGDLLKVLEVVQQGIASPEHQRFVKKLQARQTQR